MVINMNKKLVLMGAGLLLTAATASAQKLVTGHVTDAQGQPVMGATVRVPGTKVITTTDANGNFKLSGVPASAKKLMVSYIGMNTATVSVAGNVQVVLKDNELGEAVVVGYGTVKKGAFTGAVTAVKGKELEKLQVSDVSKALEGIAPGVQITTSSGQPGSSASIYIRGIGSISASTQPLIIVDGSPYEGSLNSINTADIETINLQKDASATSIYGARGSNGIILITTKKGREGKTRVSVDAKWGFNQRGVQAYKTVKGEKEYYELAWEALRNQKLAKGASMFDANVYASSNLIKELGGYNSYNVANGLLVDPVTGLLNPNASLIYHDDWLDEPFGNGFRQEYNVAVDGGSERTQFRLSFNYLKDNSYIQSSGFDRYTGRIDLQHQAFKWLKLGLNANYSHTQSNVLDGGSSVNNMFAYAQFIAPIYPIYRRNLDGTYYLNEKGDKVLDYGNNDGRKRAYSLGNNPYSALLYNIRDSKRDVLDVRGYADFKIWRGLTFHADFSLDNFATYNVSFDTPIVGDAASVNGRSTKTTQRYNVINSSQRFDYTETFAKRHDLHLMAGHETKADNDNGLSAQRTNFYLSDNPEFGNAIGIGAYPSSNNDSYHLESWFGRAEYTLDSKYSASASYRRDGSSRFAPETRWGNFWSVGAAWNLGEEIWFKSALSNVVNNFKLKASYGTQGNDNLGIGTAYLDQYSVEDDNGQIALTQVYRGNRKLKWEQSKNFNIGFETRLFNRLNVEFDYFIKQTSDMLAAHPLAPSQGSPSYYYANEMSMKNTGVELNLRATLMEGHNYHWDLGLNLTHYKNSLTRLEDGKDPSGYQSGDYWRKKGGSLFDWYMRKYAGVDPATGDALYYMDVTDADGNVTTTTTNLLTNATAYEINKSSLPDVMGGVSTNFEGFGIDFSAAIAYSIGGWVYDGSYASLMSCSSLGSAFSPDLYKRWQKPGDVTDVPRLQNADQNIVSMSSDRWLTKGTYMSLRNVTLGYTLPATVMRKLQGIESIRFYAVGDNLLLLSKRKGLDPRQSISGGTAAGGYSAMRTISFGLSLKF